MKEFLVQLPYVLHRWWPDAWNARVVSAQRTDQVGTSSIGGSVSVRSSGNGGGDTGSQGPFG